ncbi:MAG: DUF1080 domain-containing protein [Planctomycetota bacterium]
MKTRSTFFPDSPRALPLLVFGWVVALAGGCGTSATPESSSVVADPAEVATETDDDTEDLSPVDVPTTSYEADAETLLAARLSEDEASEGWVRLFDGATLFGWEVAGRANWQVDGGAIVVDRGEPCLICTSIPWTNFQLQLQFQTDTNTRSGVFLRSPLQVDDPAIECYEVNIAAADEDFPTGSLTGRAKRTSDPPVKRDVWQDMRITVDGSHVDVEINGQLVCSYDDPATPYSGRIGLQRERGRVAFREIKLRPLGTESLIDDELSKWKRYPEMPGEFAADADGLRVIGGKTQLESLGSYGDFTLVAEYKMNHPKINSGIFFRAIPGDEMMGYECQVSNEMIDQMPMKPADYGSGGIFRRQEARVVAGESGKWATIVLAARGLHFASWVNGVQVTDVVDDREPNENPRRGSRVEPGTLMIQGHDKSTDVLYRQLRVASE